VEIMRHNASAGRNYDKKMDFSSPDARGGAMRTASHRYVAESHKGAPSSAAPARPAAEADFDAADFKARWWPAPDAWQ
jgi:hypothetical protein